MHIKYGIHLILRTQENKYHDLYVKSDTILLADVFENFRSTCEKVYEVYPAHFLSSTGLAMQRQM